MPALSGGWRTPLITGTASKTRLARAPASSRWLVVAKVAIGGGFAQVVAAQSGPSWEPGSVTGERRAGQPDDDDVPLMPIGSSAVGGVADRAAAEAERAERGAEQAAGRARVSADTAGLDVDAVRQEADRVGQAADVAVQAARRSDALLLDEQARRLAAQVSDEQPFGVPGAPLSRRSDLRRGFTVTTGALLAVLLGFMLHAVRHELVLLLVAVFVAIGLDPAVRWLVRRGLSRPLAVALIAVVALLLLGAFLAAALPPLAREATQLVNAAPRYARELQDQHNAFGRLNAKYHLARQVQQGLSKGLTVGAAGGLLSAGTAVLSFALQLLLTLVLIVYFLADLPRIKDAVYRLVPLHRRPRFGLLADAKNNIGNRSIN